MRFRFLSSSCSALALLLLLAGCSPEPERAAHESSSSTCADPPCGSGEPVVMAEVGDAPGQLGVLDPEEANPEAPMSLAGTDDDERVYVLDQENQRIQLFHKGSVEREIAIPYTTVQDIALLDGGRIALLDRLVERKLFVIDADGRMLNAIDLEGPGIEHGGGTQGLFARPDGVWVDYDGSMVRLLDAKGEPDEQREIVQGRLTRDGKRVLMLEARSDSLGIVARQRSGASKNQSAELDFELPLLHVLAYDTDAEGRLYVVTQHGASEEAPSQPGKVYLSVLSRSLELQRQIELPLPSSGREVFRYADVTAGGAVFYLEPRDQQVAIRRY